MSLRELIKGNPKLAQAVARRAEELRTYRPIHESLPTGQQFLAMSRKQRSQLLEIWGASGYEDLIRKATRELEGAGKSRFSKLIGKSHAPQTQETPMTLSNKLSVDDIIQMVEAGQLSQENAEEILNQMAPNNTQE